MAEGLIEVVAVEDDGFYESELTYGSCVAVTLTDGDKTVRCGGILIWEEEQVDEELFDEWCEYAEEGVEGYTFVE